MLSLQRMCLAVVLLAPLAGCFPLSVADVALLVIPLPGLDSEGKVDLEGYSLGPLSSDEFPALLASAVPVSEGSPLISGRAEWSGLKNVKQSKWMQSVAVLTESAVLFLWWHKSRERYESLIRLPYSDIYSIEMKNPGLGSYVELCQLRTEISIGDQPLSIDRKTHFNFVRSAAVDRAKTEEAFALMAQKITTPAVTEASPDPCASDPDSGPEKAGFGEVNMAGQEPPLR